MGTVGCRGLGVSAVEHRSLLPECTRKATLGTQLWDVLWKPSPGHRDEMWVEREQLGFGSSEGAEPSQCCFPVQLSALSWGFPLGLGCFGVILVPAAAASSGCEASCARLVGTDIFLGCREHPMDS